MMRRSPLKFGVWPMKRTAFARAERIEQREVTKVNKGLSRSTRIRSSIPKMTPIRRAARGQDCTLRLAVCNFDPDTTVLCHSNFLADGKGMGLKAPDTAAAFGCSACHDVLDGRRPRPDELSMLDLQGAFYVAMRQTHEILRSMGLLDAAPAATLNLENP